MSQLIWFRLSSTAVFPRRAKQGDAGYDLVADEAACIPPRCRVAVATNVGVLLPRQTYGRVAPRSGLALKHGIDVLAGVVDQGYRDGIKVILLNTDEKQAFTVERGDKIAQLILERCVDQDEIAEEQQLSLDEAKALPQFASERGTCGFGSTDDDQVRASNPRRRYRDPPFTTQWTRHFFQDGGCDKRRNDGTA